MLSDGLRDCEDPECCENKDCQSNQVQPLMIWNLNIDDMGTIEDGKCNCQREKAVS